MSALLALSLAGTADAHRLDEYLQATLIGVTREAIEIEIQLTPGVAMLPALMSVIDQDRDGRISPAEERAYVDRVARDVQLQVDGVPAPVSLIESSFPTLEAMREGLGTIRMKLRTARTGHRLRFENRHLPQVSAYLVNCLAAKDLVVSLQQRDEVQKSIEFEYSFGPAPGSFWPAAIGIVLLARMALLLYRASGIGSRNGTATVRKRIGTGNAFTEPRPQGVPWACGPPKVMKMRFRGAKDIGSFPSRKRQDARIL